MTMPIESLGDLVSFPLVARRHPFEPAHSLFARAVELNLKGAARWFAKPLDVGASERIANLPVAEVARLCRTDRGPLENASPRFDGNWIWLMGQRFRRGSLRFERRRWCPACLREEGYHRAWWDVEAVTTCPAHLCTLVDACHHCGSPVTWWTSRYFHCQCGTRLDRVATSSLSEDECVADAYIVDRLTGARDLPHLLDRLHMDEALATMAALGRFALDPYGSVRIPANAPRMRETLAKGFAILSDPNHGMPDAIAAAEMRRPFSSGPAAPLHSDEFRYWLVHGSPEALGGALTRHFRSPLPSVSPCLGRVPYGHFTYEEADEICCVPSGVVGAVIKRRQRRKKAKFPPTVEPEFCRSFVADLAKGMSLAEAAIELGIPRRQAFRLVKDHQLETVVDGIPGLVCVVRDDAVRRLLDSLAADGRTLHELFS